MQVAIDENGVMRIEPETPLETFALREWCKASFVVEGDLTRKESGHWRGSRLIVTGEMKTPNVEVQPDSGGIIAGGSAGTPG